MLARLKGQDSSDPPLPVDGCNIGNQYALVGDHKLIYRTASGAFSPYDLKADPAERNNLLWSVVDVATDLVNHLRGEISKSVVR